jgi:hypothetical protein
MDDVAQGELLVAGLRYRDARRSHAYEIVQRKRRYGSTYRHTPEEIAAEGELGAALRELQEAALRL